MGAQAALLLACELLHYCPVDELYEEWLARITKLISAAGGSPALSLLLPRPPSCVGDAAQGVPPPPSPKKAPWIQGAQLLDATRRAQRPRGKKEAVKKSLGLKQALRCSLHQRGKTASLHQLTKTPRCHRRQRARTIKSRPRIYKKLQ